MAGMTKFTVTSPPPDVTAVLALSDGTVIRGQGIGAAASAVGEVCFNTSLTGYQEIITDPSYAGQIINFTFPHIGNVGVNDEDIESLNNRAMTGDLDVTAISAAQYPQIADKYRIMACGSSLGRNYGPVLVSPSDIAAAEREAGGFQSGRQLQGSARVPALHVRLVVHRIADRLHTFRHVPDRK